MACSGDERAEDSFCEVSFALSLDGMTDSAESRSILPETAGFENAIRSITLMIYDSSTGLLETVGRSGGRSCTANLIKNRKYTLYAFVNMGDMTAIAPLHEKDIPKVRYVISSFEKLNSTGIPMAGALSFTADKALLPVKVRRLLAKIVMSIDHSDIGSAGDPQGFSGGTVTVHRAARALYPFVEGGSAARTKNDIFPTETDFQAPADAFAPVSENIILYIPENMQGDLFEGNTDPMDKSESTGSFNPALCTYISFNGSKTGNVDGVSGELLYRFFPGKNNTENFDLEGGKIYRIRLSLTWDGMYINGNWKVDRTSWSDSRGISLSSDPDGPYSSSVILDLPPGVSGYPYYIFYTVDDSEYSSSGSAGHKTYGWTFTSEGRTASGCGSSISLSGGISCGHYADESVRSRHFITIPQNSSLIGRSLSIRYHTIDKRHSSLLKVNIAAPSIDIDKKEVTCGFDEYSSKDSFTITVTGGTVPLGNISVHSDNPHLHTGTFDPSTGSVECYWTDINTSGRMRKSELVFSGLGAEAVCRIYQYSRGSLVVGNDENAGSGNIEY